MTKLLSRGELQRTFLR